VTIARAQIGLGAREATRQRTKWQI